MSELLRVYEPSECDTQGMPLDWERCRSCRGSGGVQPPKAGWPDAQDGILAAKYGFRTCPTCGGHGSLKAATLEACVAGDRWATKASGADAMDLVIRCEDCSHPMSEGTWEDPPLARDLGYVETRERGRAAIMRGAEPTVAHSQHYSPCDKECGHDRIGRYRFGGRKMDALGPGPWRTKGDHPKPGSRFDVEASWRPVDIRTLGWPCDLRLDHLAILCLRCFAERGT